MIKLSDHLYIPSMGRVIEEAALAKAQSRKKQKREHAAAKVNRLNSGWTTRPLTANLILRMDAATLRARARQMSRDEPHFKKFLSMVRSNVIGPLGLRLQCRARDLSGKLNTKLNKYVEEVFWQWGHRETCTVSGKLNWKRAQKLFATQLARDGEALVQKLKPSDNPFGFALKFIDVSYLDETFNDELPNGNRVIMSVEVDLDGKPIAYYLTTPASDITFSPRRERLRTRVPAEEMIHAFLVSDDESQVRGVTWFRAALLDGKNLYGYKEGVIMSARMAANQVGFIETAEPDEIQLEGPEDDEGNEQAIEIDVEPLSMNVLEPGMKFSQFDPNQPTQNHEAFYKSIVRDVAAGLDVNYFSLQGDMSDVNFSSARVGYDEERDIWRDLQDFVADMFCREVYHDWCRIAILNGMLKVSPQEHLEIMNPKFQGRGWPYLEPLKDITASSMAIENKLSSFTEELAKRGVDLPDHLETLRAEQELAKEYGIDLAIAPKAAAPLSNPDDNGDDKTDDGQSKKEAENTYSNGEIHEELVN
jgi:lambda family phage portal protein